MSRTYWFVYTFILPIFRLLFPYTIVGRENIPEGGVMVCPNHAHALDPVFVCAGLGKKVRIHTMAKKEAIDHPLAGWFLTALGGYGVDRGNVDLQVIKDTLRFLKDGDKVVLFPEGTRVEYHGQVLAKSGAAVLALKAGVPVIPVYCGGKKKLFCRTTVVFGEPYYLQTESRRPTSEEYQQLAEDILRRAYALGE